MNSNIPARVILVLCASVFGVSTSVFAQKPVAQLNERQIEKMNADLSLSDEQYLRLKEAHQMLIKEQERVRADTSLTREKLMAERKTMMEAWNNSIRDILSEEQYHSWMAIKRGKDRRTRPSVRNVEDVEKLKTEVGLSEEQVKKIKNINAIMTTQFQKLRSDTTATATDRRTAAKQIVDARNRKIKESMTPVQYEKFVAYENGRAQTRERRPMPR